MADKKTSKLNSSGESPLDMRVSKLESQVGKLQQALAQILGAIAAQAAQTQMADDMQAQVLAALQKP